MLSLDSGEDLGGVEAAGPFRLSDLALFFFSLIFSFPQVWCPSWVVYFPQLVQLLWAPLFGCPRSIGV